MVRYLLLGVYFDELLLFISGHTASRAGELFLTQSVLYEHQSAQQVIHL